MSRPILAGLTVLLAVAFAACSAHAPATPPAPAAATGPLGSVPPPVGTPHAGTILVAQPPGSVPGWILPLMDAAHDSAYTVASFDYLSWRPLLWLTDGVSPAVNPALSLANVGTDGAGTTFTVTLKPGLRWSDGVPLTARDILFWYDELRAALAESPANWASYVPGLGLPDQVASVSVPSSRRIVFRLKRAVNPRWFILDELAAIQPMPAHAWVSSPVTGQPLDFTAPASAKAIYDHLAAASAQPADWVINSLWQVVDGSYRLSGFNPATGGFTMAPNPRYAGPHARPYPALIAVPFATDAAEVAALGRGAIDQGYLPVTSLGQLAAIRAAGYQAFAYPDFGWNYIAYNFKDAAGGFGAMISQLYLRQALAHLADERRYVRTLLNGLGVAAYGPVPSLPASQYAPGGGYTFSVSAAIALLKAHGWTVRPGGTDTCASPGTGPGDCGAGIPAGTPLAFPLQYATYPAVTGELARAFAADAARAGISVTPVASPLQELITSYNNATSPWNEDKWAAVFFGGFTNSAYPTAFGVFNTAGAANFGGYSDPRADALIQATVASTDPLAARRAAAYLTASQPGLFLPLPDRIVVWKKTLSGARQAFESLTQLQFSPELWYLTS